MKTGRETDTGSSAASGAIVIAGGLRLLRDGLARIVESARGDSVQVLGDEGPELLGRIEELRPAILVLALPVTRVPATELLRRIGDRAPGTACLIVGGHAVPSVVADLLGAGARSFVPLEAGADVLLEAIAALQAGRSYLPREIGSDFTRLLDRGGRRGGHELTERQREVLELIAQGLTTREIAESLGISLKTAESHRGKLMDKVGVHKASSLVRVAIQRGLLAG